MILASQIIFWIPLVAIGLILLWLLKINLSKKEISPKILKEAIVLVVAISVLRDLARIGLWYYSLKKDPLGQYLLPGEGSKYFQQTVWNLEKPFFLAILVALLLVIIAILGQRLSRRPLFEVDDIYILFLTSFIVGFPQVFVLLIASFLLMILSQIFLKIRFKKQDEIRLRLSPYLILTTIIIMILANFNFYGKFLNILHLV